MSDTQKGGHEKNPFGGGTISRHAVHAHNKYMQQRT